MVSIGKQGLDLGAVAGTRRLLLDIHLIYRITEHLRVSLQVGHLILDTLTFVDTGRRWRPSLLDIKLSLANLTCAC